MTDVSGSVLASSQSVHTAFGQAIAPNGNHRYGYVGAWGYQSLGPDADPVGFGAPSFLHVGHRYYDPSSGRFLQRDPIGIPGGLNVYEYVRSRPLRRIDPSGLDAIFVTDADFLEPIEEIVDSIIDDVGDVIETVIEEVADFSKRAAAVFTNVLSSCFKWSPVPPLFNPIEAPRDAKDGPKFY